MMDCTGKWALVTGGTGGIGKEVARGLAQKRARLIIVGRDAEKGARAEREIRAATGNRDVEFIAADLSLVREANRLAGEVASRWPALHCLVHSAGIVRGRRVLTAEGVESNFATNYLSRFELSRALLSSLQAAGKPNKAARIVVIGNPGSSGTINYDDVNLTANFSTLRAIEQFRHANNVFTAEFARRLAVRGHRPAVTIVCLHPGPTKTNIHEEFPRWMKLMVRYVVYPLFAHTPDVPAAAAMKLLLAEDLEGESGALFSVFPKFKRLAPSRDMQYPQAGRRLWEFSEQLIAKTLSETARNLKLASA